MASTAGPQSQAQGARKARRGPLTRKQILDASLRLFSEKGFARTSVRDIARGAGITDAAIYYHFASKRDLFEALFEERGITSALSDLENVTVIDQSPKETFAAIAVAAQGILHGSRDFMKVLLSEAMSGDPVATEDYDMITERWRNAEARIVREFVRQGELPPIDVDLVARQLVVLSVGPFMDALMSGEDQDGAEPGPELVERVRIGVERFVTGLRAPDE